jgi:hypothetical protein
MAGHGHPTTASFPLAYVPAVRLRLGRKDVDARHKAGHDDSK